LEDELRWKEQLHAGWTTPAEVIDPLVRRACGSAVGARSRIVGGEGNEVWSITTRSGEDLILRISHAGTYAAEQWATEQARRMGIPAPEILLVDDAVPVGDPGAAGPTQGAIWIHRAIHGQPLGTVEDERAVRRLTAQAGELLARLHVVSTSGYGRIDAQGRGQLDDSAAAGFSAYLASEWNDRAAHAALVHGISRADVDGAAALLEAYRHVWTRPHLLHGDWLPEHVLVRDDAVVGIIDFGNARSGDPAYDIAYWQFFWDADRYPTAALLAGYRRESEQARRLDLRVRLCRLSLSMRAISYYTEAGRVYPAQHAAQRFSEALTGLRTAAV